MSVIECNHVSIRYVTGDFKAIGLKEYVVRKLSHHYHVKEFWADKEITFRLEKGDMLGIIGNNGAGKSTLLKAVTGIMVPTSGTLHTEGSIAALLELASGFDDEMTVRENTYLRGALLGYTREFLDEKYLAAAGYALLRPGRAAIKALCPCRTLPSAPVPRLSFRRTGANGTGNPRPHSNAARCPPSEIY